MALLSNDVASIDVEDQQRTPRVHIVQSVSIVVIFCLQNGLNCWLLLNFSADPPAAKALFGIKDSDVGALNTIGLLGVIAMLPVAMVCKWRRSLLIVCVLLNMGSAIVRYVAAANKQYWLVVVSFIMNGLAYGGIGVYPPIIAVCLFTEKYWALIMSLTTLSNMLAGAFVSLLMPLAPFAGGTAAGLSSVLWYQVMFALALFVLTISWARLPELQHGETSPPLAKELRAISRAPVFSQVIIFSIVVGVAVGLQSVLTMILPKVGFSMTTASVASSMYQFSAVIFGIGMGSWVTERDRLQIAIRFLFLVSIVSGAFMLLLAWIADSSECTQTVEARACKAISSCAWSPGGEDMEAMCVHQDGSVTAMLMLVVMAFQGSLMGMIPLLFQEAVYSAHPASENFISGAINVFGIAVSAVLVPACTSESMMGLPSAELMFCLTLLATVAFAIHDRVVSHQRSSSNEQFLQASDSIREPFPSLPPKTQTSSTLASPSDALNGLRSP